MFLSIKKNNTLIKLFFCSIKQPKYGCKRDSTVSRRDAEQVQLSKFDESDPKQHIMKVMVGLGAQAGFRGLTEHVYFNIAQLRFGQFPTDHHDENLRGVRFIEVIFIGNCDKTQKLSINNAHTRNMKGCWRFPILEGDPSSLGASIERLMGKMHPGQTRMYCSPIKAKDLPRVRLTENCKKMCFYHRKPLGENPIRRLFKEAAEIMGLEDPSSFSSHQLRGLCITRMANDPSVSLAETMRVARHKSVSASKVYQRTDDVSEANRMKALSIVPAKPKGSDRPPSPSPGLAEKKPPPPYSPPSPGVAEKKPPPYSPPSPGLAQKSPPLYSPLSPVKHKTDYNALFPSTQYCPSSPDSPRKESPPVTLCGRAAQWRNRAVAPSMTQQGICDLKAEVKGLEDLLKKKNPPPPLLAPTKKEVSERQKEIQFLRMKVQQLTKKLKDQHEEEELYVEMVTAGLEKENGLLKRQLSGCKRKISYLEAENHELTRVIRGRRR